MSDIQTIIDSTFPFVQELLSKYGEFYPLAAAITTSGSISQIGTYEGDDHPSSDVVIAALKKAVKANQVNYTCIAIFYDVSVLNPDTKLKTDAVAVFAEVQHEEAAYIILYPYVMTENKRMKLIGNSWKEANEKEIFI